VRGSLLETAIALLGYHAVAWMQAGVLPVPQGSGSGHLVPYQAFRCQDGYMLAGAPNDGAWKRFCDALGWPDLAADVRFHGNVARVEMRDVLIPMLEARFAVQTGSGRWGGGGIRAEAGGEYGGGAGGSAGAVGEVIARLRAEGAFG
jgi:crotonobetainyl-CoA:carnitine CoA-transferase CaiB-like acyl-CoA transferase